MHLNSMGRSLMPAGLMIVLCAAQAFGGTPLIEAAKKLDKAAIRALVQQTADLNERDGDGSTALLWAAYRDDVESVDLLIRAGADLNAASDLGVTALWAASQNGNAGIVRLLLDAGANPEAPQLSGETPLMTASRSGFPEVVELLLAKGADPNARAARDQTALMWACAQSRSEVVRILLAHGADISLRTESWSEMMAVPPHGFPGYNRMIPHGSNTALLFAARAGDVPSARLLVDAGADVNDVDAWGVSATVLAAHSGFGDMVEYLLAKGADPNLAEAGFTALHIAIMRRDEKMVRDLLAHDADPNAPLKVWTPTRRGSADFHFQPELVGATPFWLAARFNQPQVMRLLAEQGADPLVVHRSETVLTDGLKWPRKIQETTAISAALGFGGGRAWVEALPGDREALILETVKTAAELGVDVNAVNNDGMTALDLAKQRKYESVVAYLQENGAR